MKLTDRKIQLTNPPHNGRITLSDGNGLCLRITSANRRSWSLQYRSNGRLLRYTIGSYPDVSLKVARQLASELRLNISKGQDPQQGKISARTTNNPTVETCFNEYADSYLKPNLKTWREYQRAFTRDVLPAIGRMEMVAVTKQHIRNIIAKLLSRDAKTLANRVLQYISKFFKWCVGVGYLESNPAADIPKPSLERPRERVLQLDEIRSIYAATKALDGVLGAFTRALMLSGQRLNEIAQLQWSEVLEDRLVLSGSRNKSGRVIITPLTDCLAENIRHPFRGTGPFVFSTTDGARPIGNFSALKRRLQEESGCTDWTFHDFRRSMATALADEGLSRFSIKCALNHTDRSVTGIYDRSEHLIRKRAALAAWNSLLGAEPIEPTDIRAFSGAGSKSSSVHYQGIGHDKNSQLQANLQST